MNPHSECRRIHALGLEQRAKGGFENGRLPFTLLPFQKEGPISPLMLPNGLSDRGRSALKIATEVFRIAELPAVLAQSDTHQLDTVRFGEHFQFSPDMSGEQFIEEYSVILVRDYGGTMANLPAEFRVDSVMTLVKGPKIQQLLLLSHYRAGEGDAVVYAPVSETSEGEVCMLPDWWDLPVQ